MRASALQRLLALSVRFRASLTIFALIAGIAFAGGGFVQIISTNQVSANTTNYRWEPASSAGGTWVTSWNDINLGQNSFPGYTSSWNGSSWSAPFQHMLLNDQVGDLFLTYAQNAHHLAMLGVTGYDVGYRRSTNSQGTAWNAPVVVHPLGDYPSVAVADNGTMVMGFNIVNQFLQVLGFQTMVSTNGGASWGGLTYLTTSSTQTFGRVVAIGNTFHFIFVDSTNSPTFTLKRMQSSDGLNWTFPPVTIDTYTAPQRFSPTTYCVSGTCGRIHYATFIDVTSAPGLGWVVVYPAARTDNPSINNVKFCAQNLGTCTTISYSTDLFTQGITTSSNGDLWLNMATYFGAPNRTLPLIELAIYRKWDGTYLNAPVNTNIQPTAWRYFASSPVRCGNNSCFSAGDYFRPAMNTFTGATIPFVMQSPRQTDLLQVLVQYPQKGAAPLEGLTIGRPVPFGADSRSAIQLSEEAVAERKPDDTASISFLRGK